MKVKGNQESFTNGDHCKITDLPVSARVKAFQKTMDLKNQNIKPVEIFRSLRADGFPVKYNTVLSWTKGVRDPLRKLNLVKKFDGDLVELIGMTIGDGHWNRIVKGESYFGGRVRYASKDFELARRAGKLMALVTERRNQYRPLWSESTHVYLVDCGSKHLVEILYNGLTSLKRLIWKHRIRFLQGIYNAEGCITVRRRNGNVYPRIYLTNSDPEILTVSRKMLRSVGIRTTIELNTHAGKEKTILGRRTITRSDVYNICIGRREYFLAFASLIGFGIRRKQSILRSVEARFQTGNTSGFGS